MDTCCDRPVRTYVSRTRFTCSKWHWQSFIPALSAAPYVKMADVEEEVFRCACHVRGPSKWSHWSLVVMWPWNSCLSWLKMARRGYRIATGWFRPAKVMWLSADMASMSSFGFLPHFFLHNRENTGKSSSDNNLIGTNNTAYVASQSYNELVLSMVP